MKLHKYICSLFLFSSLCIFNACGTSSQTTDDNASAPSAKVSGSLMDAVAKKKLLGDFTTTDIYGNAVTSDIFSEAPVTMVNVWATFCDPCIREMPDLGELATEYDGKMQIIGIIADVQEANQETALEIIEYTKADYPHLVVSEDMASGYLSQVQAVPTTIFLDENGDQLGEVYTGSRDKEAWTQIIDEILGMVK